MRSLKSSLYFSSCSQSSWLISVRVRSTLRSDKEGRHTAMVTCGRRGRSQGWGGDSQDMGESNKQSHWFNQH